MSHVKSPEPLSADALYFLFFSCFCLILFFFSTCNWLNISGCTQGYLDVKSLNLFLTVK